MCFGGHLLVIAQPVLSLLRSLYIVRLYLRLESSYSQVSVNDEERGVAYSAILLDFLPEIYHLWYLRQRWCQRVVSGGVCSICGSTFLLHWLFGSSILPVVAS